MSSGNKKEQGTVNPYAKTSNVSAIFRPATHKRSMILPIDSRVSSVEKPVYHLMPLRKSWKEAGLTTP